MKLYALFRLLFKKLFTFIFRIEVKGQENIPKTGAVLVCPNHISNWDPVLLAAVCDRQIRFMAKVSLFKIPLLGALLRALGAFPIKRGEADPQAIKTAIKCLKDGSAVGMFPQGKRYIGVEPAETAVKQGVGMIAYRACADVLPISIKTKKYRIIPFRKVYINIGRVIKYDEFGFENGTQAEYTKASEIVFEKILELI